VQISTAYGKPAEGSPVVPRNQHVEIRQDKPAQKEQANALEYKTCTVSRAPERVRGAASGGWMSEKYPILTAEEKCFYLTSPPFIEPDGQSRRRAGGLRSCVRLARYSRCTWGKYFRAALRSDSSRPLPCTCTANFGIFYWDIVPHLRCIFTLFGLAAAVCLINPAITGGCQLLYHQQYIAILNAYNVAPYPFNLDTRPLQSSMLSIR